jgi:phosphoadenosine phosphosulfate reductase
LRCNAVREQPADHIAQCYKGNADNAGMNEVVVAERPAALSDRIAGSLELLRAAVERFGRVVYSSSLGAESAVLTDLIFTSVPQIDIFTVDTGRLPESTLELLARVERRYERRIRVYYPEGRAIQRWVGEHGINGFYNGLEQRQGCCAIRKLEPFKRAVAGYDAWVTGVRSEQSEARAGVQPIEWDERYRMQKVSPLLAWTDAQIWAYIREHKLPYNPLHDAGYPSIGCAPCTRAIEPGQDHRAGRWWWEDATTRECGLQPRRTPTSLSDL